MIYLSAAVVLLGTLTVLDLVLTVGVIRRLREHTEKLAKVSGRAMMPPAMRAVGEQVGEFTTRATDGRAVSRASLSGPTLAGFFTAHCPPCLEMAPRFAELARNMAGDGVEVLAVVIGDGERTAEFAATLTDAMPVVVEADAPDLGPMATAFAVNVFPSFCLVDSQGIVLAAGESPEELPIPAPA